MTSTDPCRRCLGIVSDAAISMFSEHGAIQIIDDDFGNEDWPLASAFTDEGLENLRYIIDQTKLHSA